jgi:tetratricopeptide (TPR) repeat protein
VVEWRRILTALGSLGVLAYLASVTLLWGHYTVGRGIPGVRWMDIAVPGRFSRVETALASFHYSDARRLWGQREFGQAILSARTAVAEDPGDLEARLFLSDCWRRAGRFQEAVRVLREGIESNAADPRLQRAVVETCLDTGRYEDLLKALRQEFPGHGVRLLDGPDGVFQIAEARAALETSGAAAAESVLKRHPGLAGLAEAAPVLSQIDWELGRREIALDRLRRARERSPDDVDIQDAMIEMEFRMGRTAEARLDAREFLVAHPKLLAPQLRVLEAYGSRKGRDGDVWSTECIRFLEQHRGDPAALGQLGSLAASNGWTDLAFVLYQDSLQEDLTGFPFAVYFAGSLLKAGDMAGADEVWRDLANHNPVQLASAEYVAAMVAWGNGRRSDAEPIINQIRAQTAADLHRRRMIEDVFRSFGFAEMADRLAAPI